MLEVIYKNKTYYLQEINEYTYIMIDGDTGEVVREVAKEELQLSDDFTVIVDE